jgi:phospholipid-translocating ATPase
MGREVVKTSTETQREGEIQELLDRPRVMDGEGEVARTDVHVARSASGNLVRRKFSVDVSRSEEDIEMTSPRSTALPKTRHSVDVAELLGRR